MRARWRCITAPERNRICIRSKSSSAQNRQPAEIHFALDLKRSALASESSAADVLEWAEAVWF
jgi:hypothetical protein